MRTRSSGYKVPYDVRPSKQAERYIMVELLHKLDSCTKGISKYHYVGMGSFFFHDFRLFHHLLGIKRLTSIEGTNLSRTGVNLINPTRVSRLSWIFLRTFWPRRR